MQTKLSLFDLHCDTAYEMLRQKQPLHSNSLAVSLEHAQSFEQYVQVMAYWTDNALDNECGWDRMMQMHANLLSDTSVVSGKASVCTACPPKKAGISLLLALEDARILNRRQERVEKLYQSGIRIITPLWSGETCIGGAHDTQTGLTDFGKRTMTEACERGILLDISHASQASAEDLFEIASQQSRPVIASHSNAYDVCPVSRNLTRQQIRELINIDGLIGLNLYKHFLSDDREATREDVRRHIEYFLELGAERTLCLGGDMDGAELPRDLPNLAALPSLAEYLSAYYPVSLVKAIFFENAYHFAERYLLP